MVIPDYSWLESDSSPGAWMSVASCFTFLRSVPPQSIIQADVLGSARELDLSGKQDATSRLMSEDDEPDTAVFDAGNGWTVVYQSNCFPDQLVNAWLSSKEVQQGVVVFWNVNAVKEFSLWEGGIRIVGFEWPVDRDGADADRLNGEMQALGIPVNEPSGDISDEESDGDDVDASYAQLMALAERVTGIHLDENFLARPLLVARLNDPYDA